MLNVGMIGCGRIAQRHATEIGAVGKLVAVCDIDEQKAAGFSVKYNAHAYTKITELLKQEKNIDLIAVCTPNYLHAEHAVECLRSGFHVLCEKPMALHVADCNKMILAAANAGKELFIVKQNRFNPPVLAVKDLLDKKRLGTVFSIHLNCIWNRNKDYYTNPWKGDKEKDGGILFTQFSHFIDLIYWMFGDIENAKAFVSNFSHRDIIEFEDAGVACFRFKSGALGSIHFTINSFEKNMEGSLTIIAEKGSIKIGGEYLNKLEYQQMEHDQMAALPAGNLQNDYGSYKGSMSNHNLVYKHVSEVLSGAAKNQFDGLQGLKTVEIIEKIYQAAYETHD